MPIPFRFLLPVLLSWSAASVAATITVNSTADSHAADGACTLREALNAANLNAMVNGDCAAGSPAPVVDVIAFAIPGTGPHVIRPTSYLGQVNESLRIDGSTQAGSVPNTATPDQGGLNGTIAIEISGENCNNCGVPIGLAVTSGELTLRGLAISHYSSVLSMAMATNATFRIEGCHVGVAADGFTTGGIDAGMGIVSGTWFIGGTQAAQRNLIAARLFFSTAGTLTLQGNLIGTDRTGLAPLPITGEAMQLRIGPGQAALIGGSTPGARNVIASAGSHAVHLLGFGADGAGLRVEGNYIGVGVDGVTPLPNGGAGVRFGNSVPENSGWPRVGGHDGAGNLIAWNLGPGVAVAGTHATVTEIVGNSMHDNAIGIDNAENGPDSNDPGDPDIGPNGRMNHPQFGHVAWAAGQYTIAYRVDSAPANAAYPLRVDFYEAAGIDDNQGLLWLGSALIDLPDAQTWRSASITGPAGISLVATSTDALGRTSEFSPPDRLFTDDFE